MHERSLVRDLLRQLAELLKQHRGKRALEVRLSVGQFSGVEPQLLVSAFAELTAGSSLEDARLLIDEVPLEGCCEVCQHVFAVQRFRFVCPRCRSRRVKILRGEALLLESVTMEPVPSWTTS